MSGLFVYFELSDWEINTLYQMNHCSAPHGYCMLNRFSFKEGTSMSQCCNVYLPGKACISQYCHGLGTSRVAFMQYKTRSFI